MASTSQASAEKANSGGESLLSRNESRLQTNSVVMRVMRIFCRAKDLKPLSEIRHATRASDRMIQYWLENKYSISADDLAALLRSDAGFAILEGIIGDAKPVWWRDFKRGVKRADLRRQQKLIQQQLDEDEQGDLDV